MNKITVKCFVAAFMGILAGNSNVSAAGMTLNADDGIALANGPGYLDLDGSRYMTIAHSSDFDIEAGGTMTVTAKVYIDQYGKHQGIICNRWHPSTTSSSGNGSTTGFDIFGGYSSTQSFSNNVNLNKGSWNNLGHVWCNTLNTQKWTHVAWVYDGANGTSRLYLDGELKDTRTNSDTKNYPINPQTDILVGARYNTGAYPCNIMSDSYLKGKITDVRFYSQALTASEVAGDINTVVDASTPNLIAAYDFKDIDRLAVTDISGNGHTATLVGFSEYLPGSMLTIEAPAAGTGTVAVYNGTTELESGVNVEDGTLLTVEATPATDYTLSHITVNGTPISGNTFTMAGPTSVGAVFERDPSAPTKVLVFDMNESGSKYYRIPALVTAADGSLVALADKRGSSLSDLPNTISVVAKRSTDGGQTWSEAVTIAQGDAANGKTYGDPAVILDRNTGNLVAVFSGDNGFFASNKTNRAGFYVSKSTDNGITWSAPKNISDQLYQSNWYGAFCASGKMLQTKSGRIMFVANTRLSSQWALVDVYEYVCASDDGGETWQVLNAPTRIPAAGNGNESKLVETSDGTLIMSIRTPGQRRFSKSTDGGVTWSAATKVSDLIEPDCNGDIIVYPSADGQTRMLHSLPANSSTRRDVSIYLSYDEGETWPVCKKLIDNYSAYSSLTVLPDGSIGCFVEEGKWDSNIPGEDGFRLYFMKFTLDWLTDGADKPSQDPVYDGTLNLDGKRYMMIPNSEDFNIPAGGTITVSLRAKLTQQDTQALISNRVRNYANRNNNDVSGWAIYTVPANTSVSFNYPGSSWNAKHHNAGKHISTDEWHHLCWVYSGTSSAFYVDGVATPQPPTVSSNSAIPSYADILVGANYIMADNQKFSPEDLTAFVKGQIDDVRIYRDALSASDVTADASANAPLTGKNVIAAYDFAEINGLSVTDISGNGHTATLVGFPENAPGYTLTITTPDPAYGTLEVFDGENKMVSGRKVQGGTSLTVVATPAYNYILKEVLVNGTPIDDYTFVVNEDVTVSASFERDPYAPVEYCIPTGTPGTGRYVTTLVISDNEGNQQSVQGNGAGKGFTDRTSTVFTTMAGNTVTVNVTEGAGEWQHSYFYIDYGRDGEFDVDETKAIANGDLVTFNCYSVDGNTTWYNSLGEKQSSSHKNVVNGGLPSFTIPSDLAPGVYRARFRLAWSNVNPCAPLNDVGTEQGKACFDFSIQIQSNDYEQARTITVASDNDTLGSVAITDPVSESNTVTTAQKAVTVEATPAEGAGFINWTNAANEVISAETVYTYTGETDETFTAHFGYNVTYSVSEGGSATFMVNDEEIVSGQAVSPESVLTVTAIADAGMQVQAVEINGTSAELTDNSCTVKITEATSIAVKFQTIQYTYHAAIKGKGTVEAWSSIDEDTLETPAGSRYNDGDAIPYGSDLYLFFMPAEGEDLVSAILSDGETSTDVTDYVKEWPNSTGTCYITMVTVAGDMTIEAEFSERSAITDLTIDGENDSYEYFNMQGVKVGASDLVPGIYIVRQGNKTSKAFIRK